MIRARFAPSPTGYLHIGSAQTFFNWRIDDTDVDRSTEASLNSIYEGLNWLDLSWDEFYRQSERLDLHRKLAYDLLENGLAYRDFTPAAIDLEDKEHAGGQWLCNPEMRALPACESRRRGDAGEPFVIRFRLQREPAYEVKFHEEVYGAQSKLTPDIEEFAPLRSNGMPTYHLASCADDIDLNITHIIRGQDHLSNTFKHVLLFEGAGAAMPRFSHLPLLIAPDGSKLSKRKHGPVVSVLTYRDYGDPIDPKAQWLNSQHLRSLPVETLTPLVKKVLEDHKLEPYGASEAALTGQSVGPSAFAVFVSIGRERAVRRLEKV